MRKIILLVIIFSLLICPTVWANTTKVLDNDTELHPQGWTANSLKFKKGSTVELNDRGEVISGVLTSYALLDPVGKGFVNDARQWHPGHLFFEKKITFDEHGYVLSGILTDNACIYLIPNSAPLIEFKPGNIISFDKNGNLINGTLCDDTSLRPVGWKNYLPLDNNAGFLTFKSGTEVIFGPNAQVIKGTIANDLTVNGTTYPAGTTLQFSETSLPQVVQ